MDFSKYLGESGLVELWKLMTSYVDGKIWIGTQSNYEKQSSKILNGTIVIIIDEEGDEPPIPGDTEIPKEDNTDEDPVASNSAKLGYATLGVMTLGQE